MDSTIITIASICSGLVGTIIGWFISFYTTKLQLRHQETIDKRKLYIEKYETAYQTLENTHHIITQHYIYTLKKLDNSTYPYEIDNLNDNQIEKTIMLFNFYLPNFINEINELNTNWKNFIASLGDAQKKAQQTSFNKEEVKNQLNTDFQKLQNSINKQKQLLSHNVQHYL